MRVKVREWRESWVTDYRVRDGDGKPRRHIKAHANKRAAEAAAKQIEKDLDLGTHTPAGQSPTVRDAAKAWHDYCTGEKLEQSTLAQYQQHIDHIVKLIGDVKLCDLRKPVVKRFRNKLLEKHSRSLAKKILTSLKSIMRYHDQPPPDVTIDMADRHEVDIEEGDQIPTRDEINKLLAHAKNERDRAFIFLAVGSGMRASELRGLKFKDIDFDHGVIKVRQRADRYGVIGPCKTKGSRRDIPVGPPVIKALRLLRKSTNRTLVFGTSEDTPTEYGNLVRRMWQPLQVRAGVVNDQGEAKFSGQHCLRHFFASWCINSKKRGGRALPPKEVQKLMGHATLAMTMDTYAKLFEQAALDAADRADLAADSAALFAVA